MDPVLEGPSPSRCGAFCCPGCRASSEGVEVHVKLTALFGKKASKVCPCCNGIGEHKTGFECYLCDSGGDVPEHTPDDEVCDGSYEDGGESHRTATQKQAAEDSDDPGLIHRGLSVVLPKHIHDFVHDENQPAGARAHMLLAHVRKAKPEITSEEAKGTTGGLGNYWSPRKEKAAEYGDQGGWKAYHDHEREHDCGDPESGYGGCPSTQVVLHAGTPPEKHHWTENFRDGERYDPEASWRLPVRPDSKLMVHGISWKQGHDNESGTHRDFSAEKAEPLSRYDFLRPMRKRAKVTFGPGADEHIGEDEYDPDETWEHKGLWDRWHPQLQPTIHRHLAVEFPSGHPAHDKSAPVEDRARAVVDHVSQKDGYGRQGKVGWHWTDDPNYKHLSTGNRMQPGQTKVTLHAQTPPRAHIEDADWLLQDRRGVRDWDTDPEREVPVKRNAPVKITGVSWDSHDGPQHHSFAEPITKRASVDPSEYARREGEDGYDHEGRVRHGLSMGHLTYAQAYEHGYHGSGREDTRDDWTGKHTGGKGWQPLPQELYHTTTNAAGVMQHGLKSAQELGHKNGHGLGGTPQWLSMTYSADHAHNMLDALHEYHDHLNGKTSFADLHKAAQNGEGAQKPFHEAMTSTFGREPDAVREARMQGKRIEPGFAAHEEAAAKGWEPHPEFHQNFGQGKDGRTYGSGWTRPASIEEKHDEYGAFSRARQFEGQGKPSILFLSNDRKAFAAKDPKNFAVLKLRPKPGAQGYPMEGEHEWRTGTGHAVDVEGEPIRRKAVRTAAASGPHEVDLDAMDSASSGPTAAHVPPGTTGTDSQGHGVQMTTMDGWAHRDGSHGHEDGPDVGEQPVYTQDHTWLPEGRYWGPNSAQNDQRLFQGDHLRPEVRQDILDRVGGVLGAYDGWEKWTRVYFAGSQAAQWLDQNGQGNGDFDILIGIDFEEFRDRNPRFEEMEDAEIANTLTEELWTKANAKEYYFTLHDGRSVGPFDRTFFVSPRAWDIKALHPYAAYNVTSDDWAVHPLQVPKDWDARRLPESYWGYAEALLAEIKAIGQLPPEERHRMAANLWEELHSHRSDAFSDGGHGLFDLSNIVEKYLDQHPDHPWEQLVQWKNESPSGTSPWVPTTARRTTLTELFDPKTAADGADYGGVMIAIVPPKDICEKLAQEDGEPVEAMHITLAYMPGQDRRKAARVLPELVEGWARTQKAMTARIGGVGTFVNPGQHVLWAAVDIPHGGPFRQSLVETLERHEYEVANDHGWTPHITLDYRDHHVRFLPKVEPVSWDVTEVMVCIGDNWTAVPLG
jgi:2'-5' RNA ligase